MSERVFHPTKSVALGLALLLAFLAMASPHGMLDDLPDQAHNPALAFAGEAVVDLGDPLISDDHVDFMDRGRYPYQDMACGPGCDGARVNVVHGNLIYTRRDISIPGRGLPFEIIFTYNSGSFFNGRYGYGWQMNYNQRIVTNQVNDNVIVVREDDRTDIFIRQADDSFLPTYGVRDTLEEYAPGRYLLTDRQGIQYWFGSTSHPYVTKIEDLNGNRLTLAYNASRELTTVTDDSGRFLILSYTDDKLASISDPLGRTFQYEYDTNGDLIRVTDPPGHRTAYAAATTGSLTIALARPCGPRPVNT